MRKFFVLATAAVLSASMLLGCNNVNPVTQPTEVESKEPESEKELETQYVDFSQFPQRLDGVIFYTNPDKQEKMPLFREECKDLTGAEIEPVVHLASEYTEDATYHYVLAIETATVPNATPHWSLVKFKEEKDGPIKIFEIASSELEAPSDMDGGWGKASEMRVTEEQRKNWESAMKNFGYTKVTDAMSDGNLLPLAYLGRRDAGSLTETCFAYNTNDLITGEVHLAVGVMVNDQKGEYTMKSNPTVFSFENNVEESVEEVTAQTEAEE